MRPSVSHHRPRHVNARIQVIMNLEYIIFNLQKIIHGELIDKLKDVHNRKD